MRFPRAALALAVLVLASGCILVRTYSGNVLPPGIETKLETGRSTKAEVLRDLGPPDRLVRQYDGDVFVYAYVRRNENSIELSEPVFTQALLFSYTKTQEKSDRLVVMFDRNGIVTGVGFRRGTEQLEPF
jgi:hypothetical protein